MKINPHFILTGVLLVSVLAGIVFFIKKNKPLPILPEKPVAFDVLMNLKTQGLPDAPVKIVEYSDFECPSCRTVQKEIRDLFKNYPGKVRLTFKHFPLASHKWSVYAHQAAECMNLQGKFWSYHDRLYEKQPEWVSSKVPPVEMLAWYAKEIGADMDRFGKCMADASVTQAIYEEKEEGNKRKVSATPTFFLGEERFVGPKEIQGRGENAVRKILGMPLKPVIEKQEPAAPAFPTGIPKQKES